MMWPQTLVCVFSLFSASQTQAKACGYRTELLQEPHHKKSFVCMPRNANIQYGRKGKGGIARYLVCGRAPRVKNRYG